MSVNFVIEFSICLFYAICNILDDFDLLTIIGKGAFGEVRDVDIL